MLISFVFHYACKEHLFLSDTRILNTEMKNAYCMSLHNWIYASGLLAKAFRNLVLHEIIRNISSIHTQIKEES